MGSLFKTPEMPKSYMPKPEVPAQPQVESAEDLQKLARKYQGRAATVVTGDLEPMDIGKRTLLG